MVVDRDPRGSLLRLAERHGPIAGLRPAVFGAVGVRYLLGATLVTHLDHERVAVADRV
jgi:hypothetical protein